jgi:hypothetical protein
MEPRPLYIPVILGTTRMDRMSAHVARLLTEEVSKQAAVETDLIDIASLHLPTNNAGEAIKEGVFPSKMVRADGLVIVAPEYNHGLQWIAETCSGQLPGHDLLGREQNLRLVGVPLIHTTGPVQRGQRAALSCLLRARPKPGERI